MSSCKHYDNIFSVLSFLKIKYNHISYPLSFPTSKTSHPPPQVFPPSELVLIISKNDTNVSEERRQPIFPFSCDDAYDP